MIHCFHDYIHSALESAGGQRSYTASKGQLLTEVYDWFTEGFDTVDLQEAKVLLENLT